MDLANLNINKNKQVNNFNYLLNCDDNFKKIIAEISLKKNKNYAKYMISSFHETFLEEFNKFLEETEWAELDVQIYKYN